MPLVLRFQKTTPLTHDELDNNFSFLDSKINNLIQENVNFVITWEEVQNKPDLFSGNFNDLENTPTLFSGSYNDLTNKPTLFNGDYTNLSNRPFVPANIGDLSNVESDAASVGQYLRWNGSQWAGANVFDGNYNNLTNKPFIPSDLRDLADVSPNAAASNQVLQWDGSQWAPATLSLTATYTATVPTDWDGTPPTTVGDAIDRLATVVKALNGGIGA